jgi:hypothetical protein
MKLEKALKKLSKKLENSPALFEGYKANIAVAFQDACTQWRKDNPTRKSALPAGVIYDLSNNAATTFLKNLISLPEPPTIEHTMTTEQNEVGSGIVRTKKTKKKK